MSSPAERQRRYRDRQRRGEKIAALPVDIDLEEGLRAHGFLPAWSEAEPAELSEAALAALRLYVVAREPQETGPQRDTVTRNVPPNRSRIKHVS